MLHDTHGCWILIYCSFPLLLLLLLLLLFQVDALRGVGVRQIACGSGHTVVLTTDGEGTVTGNANFSMGCSYYKVWYSLFSLWNICFVDIYCQI